METRWALSLCLCMTLVGVAGCLEEAEPDPDPNPNPTLTSRFSVSDCGGFTEQVNGVATQGYCDAEMLDWTYNASDQTLVLRNSRVVLNCCGDHSMNIELVDGVYVVTETDAPIDGLRCNCICVFDFELEAEGIAAGPIELRLDRHIMGFTDADPGEVQTVWQGTVDLSAGQGSEIIDDTTAGPWCESEPPPPVEATSEVSECGGFDAAMEADSGDGYCDAETLRWSYDAGNQALSLRNDRALLNCCGDHSMDIDLVDGVYVVTETDAPVNAGRCDCMCVFDFSMEATGVPEGVISLRLVRDVTDGSGPQTLWDGDLDLSEGSGAATVSTEDVGAFCEGPSGLEGSFRMSDCGGFEEPEADSGDGYCDAEMLNWTFDSTTAALELNNTRALLNCCGDHSMSFALVAGVYEVTEVDAPDGDGGRCDCMCVFDFGATIDGVPGGTINLRLLRDVTDLNCGPQTNCSPLLWDGQIDLAAGSGSITISDQDAGMWCE